VRLGLSCYSYRLVRTGEWAGGAAGNMASGPGDLSAAREQMVSARGLLAKARDLGLEGVQLLGRAQADSRDFSGLVALRQEAEEQGLFLELAASGTQPEAVKAMVRTASVLGSPVLSLRLGQERPAGGSDVEGGLRRAADNLRESLPTCEKYGVALAVENDMDYTSGELLHLLERLDSEWVGISFDTGNQLAVLEAPEDALAAFGPYVYNVHLSDWQIAASPEGLLLNGCALGEGVVDLPALVKLARRHSPQVSLLLASRLEQRELPLLSPAFLDRFSDRRPHDLAALFRLFWERGLREVPPPPEAAGESEAEKREEAMVGRSARYLLQLAAEAGSGGASPQEPRCSKPN